MFLYDVNKAALAYCMVDTPQELIGYENEQLHRVGNAPSESLVTMLTIDRDLELEQKMLETCKQAIDYYNEYINQIHEKINSQF